MGGRAVLVTGGSYGIGRAVAERFAAGGDRVAVGFHSSPERADAVVAALPGDGHLAVRADQSDPQQARGLVEAAVEGLGGLEVLVNNAGGGSVQPVVDATYEQWQADWERTVRFTLLGPVNVTWCAVPYLVASGRGRVVNMGTRGVFRGEPDQPAYGAAKAGLHSFGQSMAQVLAPHGVAVTTVAPGFVETDRVRGRLAGAEGEAIRAQSPFGRVATPEEVAEAVHFLASDGAEFCSGAILDVNGASYLR